MTRKCRLGDRHQIPEELRWVSTLPLCPNVGIKSETTGTGFKIILPAMGNTLEQNAVVKYQIPHQDSEAGLRKPCLTPGFVKNRGEVTADSRVHSAL